MKLRKQILLVMLVILAFVMSCGNSSEGGNTSGKEKTLTVMMWDANQKDGVQSAINEFMKQNPDIKVVLEVVPSDQYYTKLDAALGAQSGPDVMWQSGKGVQYIEAGVLEPLDEYIKRDNVDMSKYEELITKIYNVGGKQYGIPKDMDAWFFVYNKKLFDKYGVEYPKPDWTYDEMVEIARKLRSKMAQDEYPVYIYNDLWFGLSTMIAQAGTNLINPDLTSGADTPQAKEAVDKAILILDEKLMADKMKIADYNAVNSLVSGKLAMSAIPSWNLILLVNAGLDDGSMVLTKFPSINGSSKADTNGLSYTMNKFSKNKEEAWKLIKFLTSKEGSELHARNGAGIPAYKEAQYAFVENYKKIPGIDLLEEITGDVFLRISTAYPKARPAIQEISDQILPKMYSKEMTVEEGLKKMKEKIEIQLKQ